MSRPRLRPTVEGDLPAISELTEVAFARRRSVELLRWLLTSGEPGVDLESVVAESEGRLVGHAAALRCRYRWHGQIVVGGHALLWMVAPEARGPAGMALGAWSGSHGDFSLVVGGTQHSKPILARRRYVRAARAFELRLPTARPGAGTGGEWELAPYDPGAGTDRMTDDGPIVNLATAAHLRWLAACPELTSRLLTLRRNGEGVGPVLLFINHRLPRLRGRIVHLPWLGEDWHQPLRLAVAELGRAGCESASLLATSPELISTARQLGGEVFYERPVWFRDARGRREPSAWHLSYLEADLAYRNV